MNVSNYECSSKCESGWTMYLDQSSNFVDHQTQGGRRMVREDFRYTEANLEDKVEDEDLSMVSDASSGPPHFQEDEHYLEATGYSCYGSSVSEKENKRKNNKKIKKQRGKQKYTSLDDSDTASSPVLSFSKKHNPIGGSMEHTSGFSKGFSATQFKVVCREESGNEEK